MIRLLTLALVALAFSGGPAWAVPVPFVAAFLGVTATGFVAAAATFVVNTIIGTVVNLGINKIFGPKTASGQAGAAQERQASVLNLAIGETSRELLIGEVATGGSLAGAFNHGGEYGTDWVVKVVILADHLCQSLEGVYINDTYVAFAGDGPVGGYNDQLVINWRSGAEGETFPADILTAWQGSPLHASLAPASVNIYRSQAYVTVAYKADAPDAEDPVWSGHPQFLFKVRGKKLYDPRKDSTVGGSGAHRWADPSTWEWSRNLAVARYNWLRGVYAFDRVAEPDMLLIGRGLSAAEAPPERVFAYANLCDEAVAAAEGGTEPRYLVDGAIRATEPFLNTEQMFGAACGGEIIQPDGGVEIEPGQGKTPVASITDADLVVGQSVEFSRFGSDADRINTVIPRYIEPSQKWSETAAPVQRDLAAVLAEGSRDLTLSLSLVTRASQAQRVAAIRLRCAAYERTAKVTLPPRFAEIEAGDWIAWTSARHTDGEAVTFRVRSSHLDAGFRNTLTLEEVNAAAYGFGGSPLPGTGQPAPPPIDALILSGVTAEAIDIEGTTGAIMPAVRFHWDTPVSPDINRIRAEVRRFGLTEVAPSLTEAVNAGELLQTNGVPPNASIEVRLVPLGAPGRPIVPSPWIPLTTGDLVVTGIGTIAGLTPAQVRAILEATAAQGEAAARGLIEAYLRLVEQHEALTQLTLINGVEVKSIVLDEIEFRTEGQALLVNRTNLIGLEVAGGTAFQLSDLTLKASLTETWGQFRSGLTTTLGANAAAILAEQTARTSADGAFASSLSTVVTTVGGHTASITTLQTSVNGLNASWTLSLNVNGHVSGIHAVNNGTVSGIVFLASQIGFSNTGGTGLYPLAISGSEVWATSFRVDRVMANSIVTGSLIGGAVTGTSWDEQSGSSGLSGSAVQVFSQTHATVISGAPHKVDINVTVSASGSGPGGVLIEVKRDGVSLGQRAFRADAGFQYTSSPSFYDTPSSGSHTYTIELRTTGGTTASITWNVANMLVTEFKR